MNDFNALLEKKNMICRTSRRRLRKGKKGCPDYEKDLAYTASEVEEQEIGG